jgi:drug/metabolite transporter (DMT)-like permease
MSNRFPLKDAAASAARVWAALGGIAAGLAGVGILTVEQNTALQATLAAVAALITAASTAAAAFGVRRQAEPLVTPISDPQNNAGMQLVARGERLP